ncbi:amidohydrolase [Mesorhizobium sp. ZMM04-5]|uniref:Amidohydrolase n=1 Tax=Mesorhizobium marinum TaxID=3228790 RepID=A0ABV3R3Y3_9HYPH
MPGMVWKYSLLAATAAMLFSSAAYADTVVLRGARVLTMDDAKPEAEAIALVDGRIAAVGTAADVEPYLKGARVYDLPADALVLPGFQDSHNHLIWSATQAEDIDLSEAADEAGLRAAIEPAMAAAAEGGWLRGGGWSVAVYKEPNAAVLDAITGDRPAWFEDIDGHSGWANSAALKAAGIDASTRDPEGGRIDRDAQGNPTGLLREEAMALVSDLLPDYPQAQVDAGFEKAQAEAIGYGLTAIIDPSAEEWMLAGYQRAEAANALKLRVGAAVKVEAGDASPVERVTKLKAAYSGPRLEVTSVKLFVDGVIETGTAALLEAYVGSNTSGDLLFTPEELKAVAVAADAAGFQLHAHSIGDRAIRVTLDAYEAAEQANGKRDRRPIITHVQLVNQADIPRFKQLGVLPVVQALWAYPDPYIVDLTQPKIGPERSEWLYPFGALKEAGATIVGSSDWSVSSMNPLEAIQTGVTRQDFEDPEGAVLTPQHRLDVMDMLRAYTVNGAYAAFDEAESGTLTVGKRADVVVLDKDVTKIAPTEIVSATVLATLIDGEPVHEGEGLPKPTMP